MKILIAADLHYPTINGVATFSRNLAKGLAARGHEVLVIAPSQTGKPSKEVDGNYVIARLASVPFPLYQNFRISLSPNREVRKILLDFQPDVIHIQMLMWIGQAAMRYGNKFGVPIVSTNHAIPENLMDNLRLLAPVSRPINYLLKAYGAHFHSKADYITMPTQSAIDMFGRAAQKIPTPKEAVSNGIDLSRFTPGPVDPKIIKKFNIPTDKPIITYIGRLDAEKHLPVLINAFAQVREKTDAHLLVVGFGTDQARLELMVHEAGLVDHVTFTGRVEDDELLPLHRVGTVYCMPSPAELQSIATLEAMATGQPVVAVDAGALKELCQDGRNGFLCRKDDADQIAESLLKIVTDPKLREQFSKESLKIAKTHDLDDVLARFENIYQRLIAD